MIGGLLKLAVLEKAETARSTVTTSCLEIPDSTTRFDLKVYVVASKVSTGEFIEEGRMSIGEMPPSAESSLNSKVGI